MPTQTRFLDTDVVKVYRLDENEEKIRIATLLWGDSVRVVRKTADLGYELDFTTRRWDDAANKYVWERHPAFVSAKTKFRDEPLLKLRFVDVGQGDAAIIESPKGQLILVDGGEETHLSRYFCTAWAHVLRTKSVQ